MIAIRQATTADVDTVSSILRDAAGWLTATGTPMWRADELLSERIVSDVSEGLFFLAESGGEPAGTVKFQLSDPEFWPDVPESESAFIHRLSVRRRFAGGAVSSALLSWAAERTASLGRPFLRLDCEASRAKLRTIYERFGFQHHSDRQVGPYFVARYQLPVEDRVSRRGTHRLEAPRTPDEWASYHAIRRVVLWERRGHRSYDERHPDEFAPDHFPLLLFHDEDPVGVVRVDIAGTMATCRRVAVREDAQRLGHGRAMLALAEAFARSKGCDQLCSFVNPGAVGFYVKCGFRRDASRSAAPDHVPMQKNLVRTAGPSAGDSDAR